MTSDEFDYIIVGGSTAGLVVASRLSEDPEVTVGVLEAGDWHQDIDAINVPGLSGATLGDPRYDWCFKSVPQRPANDHQIFLPRGKGLGGSSLVNFTGMNRASAREYDTIQELGNPGWNWQETLKYMKKTEKTQPLSAGKQTTPESHLLPHPGPLWHGTSESGPLVKGYPTYFWPLHAPIVDAFESLGVKKNLEPNNGEDTIGSHTVFSSIDPQTATRSHSASAYHEPFQGRSNLIVLTGSLVSRVKFRVSRDSHLLVAEGVEFVKDGQQYFVSAERDVILCAGIGCKKILSSTGIETLVDLPGVGENLREFDHPCIATIYEIDDSIETIDLAAEPGWFRDQRKLYDEEKKGFLSSSVSTLYTFLPSKAFASAEQIRQWKGEFHASMIDAPSSLRKQLAAQSKWFLEPNNSSGEAEIIPFPGFFLPSGLIPQPGKRYSSMICAMMHPLSRGCVHITSSDPAEPPAIDPSISVDPNCLSNPLDFDMLLAVLKFARSVYETSPIRQHVIRRIVPSVEDCRTDDTLKKYIKNMSGFVYHPVGTAAMMPQKDGGVVDPELRVYGTRNLRVVDASILPMQLAAHPQATVYAIAEKAADIIKNHYKQASIFL